VAKTKPPKKRRAVANVAPASRDLRNIPALIERWLAGEDEAHTALMGMGRHAAHSVAEAADREDHEGLRQLGRKLAAIPPQSDTNLYTLRRASVRTLVRGRGADAPALLEADPFPVGPEVALFDPMVLAEDLAGPGRPRRSAERLSKGDLAWFGLPDDRHLVQVRAGQPEAGQAVLRLRLEIRSGVVVVGPPEASDGHRWGAVRLDPFASELHGRADRVRWFALAPAVYAVRVWRHSGRVQVHLDPEPKPRPRIRVDVQALRVPEAGAQPSSGTTS
jgi:hypothetical protein